jgi:hypothetical protein
MKASDRMYMHRHKNKTHCKLICSRIDTESFCRFWQGAGTGSPAWSCQCRRTQRDEQILQGRKEIMISADIMTRSMSEVLGWPLLNFVWQGALIASISYSVCAMPQCPPAFTLSDCLYRHVAVPVMASAEHSPAMAGTSNAQSGGGITTGNKPGHCSGSGVGERKRFVAGIGACLPSSVSGVSASRS